MGVNNTKRPNHPLPPTDLDGEYRRGPTGIDEERVVEAFLRLEEIAMEVGWVTARQIIRKLLRTRRQRLHPPEDSAPI